MQVKLTRNDHDSPQGRDLLTSRIGALFVGTYDDPANIPTLGTGHQSKGLEWETVYILEPASMMLQKIVERGGLAAEDKAHVKHVMVSRPRTRLVYLKDVFFADPRPGVSMWPVPRLRGRATD